MTVPVSTVPVAISNLMALITTQIASDVPPSGEPILLTLGEPTTYEPADMIQIGMGVRRTVTPREFVGGYQSAGPLSEEYDIGYQVSSWSGDPDPLVTLQRAYTLLGYVEAAVRTDPTLGTEVLESHPAGSDGGDPEWSQDPVGRLVTLTASIRCFTLN